MITDMETTLAALQQEVQRRLGRCMLRLQQCEHLLKVLVGSMAVEGPCEQFEAIRDGQVASVRKSTLGTLVKMFTDNHLTMEPPESWIAPGEAHAGSRLPDAPWASISFTVAMTPGRHAQTKTSLAELVILRNDLVHHLAEKFSFSDEEGCRAAAAYLEDSYGRIDGHCRSLGLWRASLGRCLDSMSGFLKSPEAGGACAYGTKPDPVCWPGSPIVACLREAEKACMEDGWASLDAAVRFVSKNSRDQVPSRYDCRTWRQVLKRSGQFEVRSTAGSGGVPGQTWYRSLPDLPQSAPGCDRS